jgi:hypothetical protein
MPKLYANKMNNKILRQNQSQSALRARSVSKDYKLMTEQKYGWRDEEKQILEEKKTEGCTFKPDLKKSKTFQSARKTTYVPTNFSNFK